MTISTLSYVLLYIDDFLKRESPRVTCHPKDNWANREAGQLLTTYRLTTMREATRKRAQVSPGKSKSILGESPLGKRGPVPESNALRILKGNPSKRPLKGELPKPKPARPACPSWLSLEAKREWRRLAPELARIGLLTKLDIDTLAGYCSSYSVWRKAQEVLANHGSVYVTPKGQLKARPEIEIANTAAEQMKSFASELGLTPSSRARMQLTQGPSTPEEEDPMEALLNEGKRSDFR
jgi:P27 family predicted phage terminase small subunit